MNSQNKEVVQQSTDRSFTSIQMVHTHQKKSHRSHKSQAGKPKKRKNIKKRDKKTSNQKPLCFVLIKSKNDYKITSQLVGHTQPGFMFTCHLRSSSRKIWPSCVSSEHHRIRCWQRTSPGSDCHLHWEQICQCRP